MFFEKCFSKPTSLQANRFVRNGGSHGSLRSIRQSFDAEAAIAKVFAEVRRKQIDFAYCSDAGARPGNRELHAVKIPASYDA